MKQERDSKRILKVITLLLAVAILGYILIVFTPKFMKVNRGTLENDVELVPTRQGDEQ